MLIPTSKAKLIKKYQPVLFNEDISDREKFYGFYLLVAPLLDKLKEDLTLLGLAAPEIESESYIFSCMLCQGYIRSKGNLVTYLSKYLPWGARKYLLAARKNYRTFSDTIQQEEYFINDSYYWRVPSILYESKYIGKCFTRSQKYIIYMILTCEDDNLSELRLSRTLGVNRKTYRRMLSEIRDKITLEEI